MIDGAWEKIDAALIRMRRLMKMPRISDTVDLLSAVLVVDGVVRPQWLGERTRIADIAANLTVKPSTASRIVDATEAAGFVQCTQGTNDYRSFVLVVTPAGEVRNLAAKHLRIIVLPMPTRE